MNEQSRNVSLSIKNTGNVAVSPQIGWSSNNANVRVSVNRCVSSLSQGKSCSLVLSIPSPNPGELLSQDFQALIGSTLKDSLSLNIKGFSCPVGQEIIGGICEETDKEITLNQPDYGTVTLITSNGPYIEQSVNANDLSPKIITLSPGITFQLSYQHQRSNWEFLSWGSQNSYFLPHTNKTTFGAGLFRSTNGLPSQVYVSVTSRAIQPKNVTIIKPTSGYITYTSNSSSGTANSSDSGNFTFLLNPAVGGKFITVKHFPNGGPVISHFINSNNPGQQFFPNGDGDVQFLYSGTNPQSDIIIQAVFP